MGSIRINQEYLKGIRARIQDLFLSDEIPWVVGYSGGKDSTAVLQLVWEALSELSPEQRNRKPVHVISTDTLVEQPVVAAWVAESLELMRQAAKEQAMPIQPHRLTPRVEDSYWVNLIGRGYPAPRPMFRWCTSRLKIEPSNRFILEVAQKHGQAIVVLGTRKAESAARAQTMERYEKQRVRDLLSPNGSLPNSWVFTPIEDWSNDDVWLYLMQNPNPWGRSNKDLLTMYRGATADNECPLVVDTSTPSCGSSRFGCWVCTLVTADKSMEAMIQNDREKEWMTPLLEFRNNEIGMLDEQGRIDDRHRRDFRRMDGTIKLNPRDGRPIPGPYTKRWREHLLRRLLEVENEVIRAAPPELKNYRLISDAELREIRRIWVEEKHEFDDALPRIYEEVKGEPYPYMDDLDVGPFGKAEWDLLRELCGDNEVFLELQASLLNVEQSVQGTTVRRAVVDKLEQAIKRCYFEDETDAQQFAEKLQRVRGIEQLSLEHEFESI